MIDSNPTHLLTEYDNTFNLMADLDDLADMADLANMTDVYVLNKIQ